MKTWNGKLLSEEISNNVEGSVVNFNETDVYIKAEKIYSTMKFLKETSGFSFDLLSSVTAVDYFDHFEVVYQLKSLITLTKELEMVNIMESKIMNLKFIVI